MLELEKTYLLKFFPQNLKSFPYVEIIDLYIPKSSHHPTLRIRKTNEKYEITKKQPAKDSASEQIEKTISLSRSEFNSLKKINSKKIHKIRYYYKYKNQNSQIDIFQDSLKGLVLVDFEFDTKKRKDDFKIPNFCLLDVTEKKFMAGGMLCGKNYKDIETKLQKLNYKKLFLK